MIAELVFRRASLLVSVCLDRISVLHAPSAPPMRQGTIETKGKHKDKHKDDWSP